MKLLHPEVDVTPGRAGKRPQSAPYQDREKLDGSAVLRLTNDTTQENAYTVRLRCDNPFWQEGWYTVTSLPAAPGAPTTAVKPDVPGHQGRSVKVFVPRGAARDILIRFSVPARPESRAGRYDYVIEVETQVSGPQAGDGAARRKDRVTSLPAIANVRPFYKWGLDLTPDQRRVGRRRRSGEFDVVVTNEGNDWLYCDLQLPRPKDLLLDCPTLRLAVPPPEPGELLPAMGTSEGRPGTQRTVPLVATTRLKTFRGDLTPQPLMLTALRVDAPSLPPPPEDGFLSLGSVVATEPTPPDAKPAPADRALLYAPPIPAKLLDFFSRGAGSLRAWIAPVLMLAIAIPAALLVFQKLQFAQGVKPETRNLPAPNRWLIIGGPGVLGSKISLMGQIGSTPVERVLESKPLELKSGIGTNRCRVFITKDLDGFRGKLRVERAGGLFSILPSFMAVASDIDNVQIGDVHVAAVPTVTEPLDGQFKPGEQVPVKISGFGGNGTVLLDGVAHKAVGWTEDHVTIRVPDGAPGKQFVVALMPEGASQAIPAGSITLASSQVASGGTGGGGTSGSGGKTGGGGGGASSGGGKPAGGGGGAKAPAKGGGSSGGGGNAGSVTHLKPSTPTPTISAPPSPVAHGNSSVAYTALLTDDFAGAIRHAGNSDAFGAGVEAYADIKSGNSAPAEPLIQIALKGDSRAQAMGQLAQGASQEASGNKDAAKASYDQAAKTDPTLLKAYLAKALLLYNSHPTIDERNEANQALTAAYKMTNSPQDKAAFYYASAKCYTVANLIPAAIKSYHKAVQLVPSLPKPAGLP